jgi:hypothetical protein
MTESCPPHSSAADHQVNGEHRSLRQTCAELHERVNAFLDENIDDELLKRVQDQTRISLGVVEEALSKYRSFGLPALLCLWFTEEADK